MLIGKRTTIDENLEEELGEKIPANSRSQFSVWFCGVNSSVNRRRQVVFERNKFRPLFLSAECEIGIGTFKITHQKH